MSGDRPYVDPTTGHTPGYPRPYVAYPFAVPMREDLADAGRTVTVERLGEDAPEDRRGELAIIERGNGVLVKVIAFESEVPGGRDAIEETARRYADQVPARAVTPVRPATPAHADLRFTHGLIYDVFKVLKAHGYIQPDDNRSTAVAMLALGDLVKAFEGRS